MQPGDVPVTYADTGALERDFGYKPQRRSRTVFVNSRSGIASSTGISWVIAMSNVYSSDRIRFGGGSILSNHALRFVWLLRKCQNSHNPLWHLFRKEDGLQIWSRDRACPLDWRRLVSGSRFWHYGKPECRYRRNCNMHKGVTIGRENRGKRKGAPVLGDCVWLGVNSTIVGGVRLGNDVLVAPNTYVNCDVPSHRL